MKIIESATILAFITGLLYLFGYVYFESFYTAIGIEYKLVTIPFETLLTFGSVQFLWIISIAFSVSLIACFIPKNKYTEKLVNNSLLFPKSPFVTFGIFILLVTFAVLSSKSAKHGQQAGKNYLLGKCQLVKVFVKGSPSIGGCLVPNKASDIWILPLSTDSSSIEKSLDIIPKSMFLRLKTYNNLESLNKAIKSDS